MEPTSETLQGPHATPSPLAAHVRRLTIYLAAGIGGGVLLALEILAFRLVGRTFGSALRETSVVISIFLGAMSVGYAVGGRLADRWPRIATLIVPLAAAGLLGLMIPALDRWLSPAVFASSLPLSLHAAAVTVVLFVLPTVALATLSPIAVRLLLPDAQHGGRTAGTVSAVSTAGSIVGSLAGAFLLIDLFKSVDRSIWFLSALALLTAACIWLVFQATAPALYPTAERRSVRPAYALSLLATLALAFPWLAVNLVAAPATGLTGEGVVFRQDSPFHHVTVRESATHRTLAFDQARQSTMPLGDPYGDGFAYTNLFHVAPLLAPMERALFIGLGGGTGPKQFVHDYPGVEVDAVEIDPLVVEVAQRFFDLEPSPRLRVHLTDGRAFVRRATERWDVIVIDAYSTNLYGSTIPPHLTTTEFFDECRERLAPSGVLVYNVASPASSQIARALSQTIAQAFESQLVLRAQSSLNTVFVASDQELPLGLEALHSLLQARAASGDFPVARLAGLIASASSDPLLPHGVPVLTDDYAPVDTLIRAR